MMGFPTIVGRLAIAAVQTMQRAKDISPGLRADDNAIEDSAFTATALWQCSLNCFEPS